MYVLRVDTNAVVNGVMHFNRIRLQKRTQIFGPINRPVLVVITSWSNRRACRHLDCVRDGSVLPRHIDVVFSFECHHSHHHIINFALLEECLGPSGVLDPSFEKVCSWVASDDTHDSSLDDCTSTVHARRMSDKKSTTSKRNADSGRIRDRVEFGVAEPEELFGSLISIVLVCRTPTRGAVVSNRTDLESRPKNERADFCTGVFAEIRYFIDDPHVFCELAEVEGHTYPFGRNHP